MRRPLAVVIPARDEAPAVGETLRELHRALPEAWVVVVDNASTDGTGAVAAEVLRATGLAGEVVREPRVGKGHAVETGLAAAPADVHVLFDADGTSVLDQLPVHVARVRAGVDVVVGRRDDARDQRPLHASGNRLVSWIVHLRTGCAPHDVLSGYRVCSGRFIAGLPPLRGGFELETELSLHAARTGAVVESWPVGVRSRPPGTRSKLNTVRDGARILRVAALG